MAKKQKPKTKVFLYVPPHTKETVRDSAYDKAYAEARKKGQTVQIKTVQPTKQNQARIDSVKERQWKVIEKKINKFESQPKRDWKDDNDYQVEFAQSLSFEETKKEKPKRPAKKKEPKEEIKPKEEEKIKEHHQHEDTMDLLAEGKLEVDDEMKDYLVSNYDRKKQKGHADVLKPQAPLHRPRGISVSGSRRNISALAAAARLIITGLRASGKSVSQEKQKKLQGMLSDIDTFNFDSIKADTLTDGRPLFIVGQYLFHNTGTQKRFDITQEVLNNFLNAIETGYHDNPYHNKIHATDVLVALTFLLKNTPALTPHLTDLDVLAAMTAAIIHDYDHPGYNNAFYINKMDDLATLYNDKSVLENHHVASAFKIMKDPNCNILKNLDAEDFSYVREMIIEMVLATDMKGHFIITDKFARQLEKDGFNPAESVADKTLLMKMVIKISDIGHLMKTLPLTIKWTQRIQDEFFHQGDVELESGVDVSPFMDRRHQNIPKSQIGFINFVIMPFMKHWLTYSPECKLLNSLSKTSEYWQKLMAMGEIGVTVPDKSLADLGFKDEEQLETLMESEKEGTEENDEVKAKPDVKPEETKDMKEETSNKLSDGNLYEEVNEILERRRSRVHSNQETLKEFETPEEIENFLNLVRNNRKNRLKEDERFKSEQLKVLEEMETFEEHYYSGLEDTLTKLNQSSIDVSFNDDLSMPRNDPLRSTALLNTPVKSSLHHTLSPQVLRSPKEPLFEDVHATNVTIQGNEEINEILQPKVEDDQQYMELLLDGQSMLRTGQNGPVLRYFRVTKDFHRFTWSKDKTSPVISSIGFKDFLSIECGHPSERLLSYCPDSDIKERVFQITTNQRELEILCNTAGERNKWVIALALCQARHKIAKTQLDPPEEHVHTYEHNYKH